MRPGEGSPDAAHKVSPHHGHEAQERDALLRRRYEDGPLPSAAVVRAASASASPPRYVPLPTGCFHTWDSQRRQREAMAAQTGARSPSQEAVRQSKSPSASRERSPSRPLLSPAPHTETSPGYSDSGDAAAVPLSSPPPPPPPLPQQTAAPALGTRPYHAPTRTVSPSKRLLPIHNATAAKDASPISPPHHHHHHDAGASPGSGGASAAAASSPPPQVSTPPRFSPARSPARATARSCADPTAFTPYTPPRARPAPEAREATRAGAPSSPSPQRTALRSRSVDAAGSPAAASAAASASAALRLVVSASDKWTTLPPQAWLVAPGERVLSLVRRCGLAEPDAPDAAFQGFTLRVPAKGVTWSSKTHRNVSVASLGLASGDEVVVASTWATYRH